MIGLRLQCIVSSVHIKIIITTLVKHNCIYLNSSMLSYILSKCGYDKVYINICLNACIYVCMYTCMHNVCMYKIIYPSKYKLCMQLQRPEMS